MNIKKRLRRILPLSLNLEIKNILDYFRQEEIDNIPNFNHRVFFCDAATYGNLGDLAIAVAMSNFLIDLVGKDRYIEIPQSYILKKWNSLKQNIREDDIICLSGGGNMGDMYPRFEAIRRKIIKGFPNNRIIIFPQTIDYKDDSYGKRELKRSISVYNKHSKLLVCARELKSFKLMKSIYKEVYLVPDIVFYLSDNLNLESVSKIADIGVCLRNDSESVLSAASRKKIFQDLELNDYSYIEFSTTIKTEKEYLDSYSRKIDVNRIITHIKQFDYVITDRLHGMIFSIIAGVPCLALDNSNHKVFGVLQIIQNSELRVQQINNIEEICSILKNSKFNVGTKKNKYDFEPIIRTVNNNGF